MSVRIDRFCLRSDSEKIRAECSLILDSIIINRVRLLEYERGKFSISLPYWKDHRDNSTHEYVIFSDRSEKEKALEFFLSVYRASIGESADSEIVKPIEESSSSSLRELNLKLKSVDHTPVNGEREKDFIDKHRNFGRISIGDAGDVKK